MSASVTNADWSILGEEGVVETAERAARTVARKYNAVEIEDMLQEAYIILATRTDQMYAALDGGLSHLYRVLWQDLTNLAKVQQDKANRNDSIDAESGGDRAVREASKMARAISEGREFTGRSNVDRETWLDLIDMEKQVRRAQEYNFPVTVRRVGE